MSQVKSFLESLNKVSSESSKTIEMEVVGENSDIYQNIFPVIADVSVVYKGKNEFGQEVGCKNFDVLFVDEKASSEESKCQYSSLIIRQGDKYDFKFVDKSAISFGEIERVMKARDISFF